VDIGKEFEARVEPCFVGDWEYQYRIGDHLDNTRVIFADQNNNGSVNASEIIQEMHYSPFGRLLTGDWNAKERNDYDYRYNNKELVEDFGLGWMDYGARFYDPSMARWTSVDKLADHPNQIDKSPYAYAWNNPISLTDPDGNCPNCPDPIMTRANEQLANGEISPQELVNTALSVLAVDAAAASVFLPGPEDVVGAAVAATAIGSKVIGALSKFGGKIADGFKSLFKAKEKVSSNFGKKISKQLDKRGWSEDSVNDLVNNPSETKSVRDTRWTSDGTKLDDPATAYIKKDGNYVIRNDKTGDITQVSNRNDPNWKAPWASNN
jgi:RHS repeat-associated protein